MLLNQALTKKAIFKCENIYKEEFRNSKCSLTISVGQPAHEGDKLISTLIAVQNNFKECIIMVCDSLQRHNLTELYPLNDLEIHQKSNNLGDLWLQRNLPYIKEMDIDYNIIRWDYWLQHKSYNSARQKIDNLYNKNLEFNYCIQKTANSFYERNISNFSNTHSSENILNSSIEYLKEECAVMLLWIEYNIQFEIYPSQRNEAMRFIYQHLIKKNYPSLLREVSIKFKNISLVFDTECTKNKILEVA